MQIYLDKGFTNNRLKSFSFLSGRLSMDNIPKRKNHVIYRGKNLKISVSKEMSQFKCKGNINFDVKDNSFNERENGRYSLNCSNEEIKLTDNLLDEVISSWSINFTLSDEKIPFVDGEYQFYMEKAVFDIR